MPVHSVSFFLASRLRPARATSSRAALPYSAPQYLQMKLRGGLDNSSQHRDLSLSVWSDEVRKLKARQTEDFAPRNSSEIDAPRGELIVCFASSIICSRSSFPIPENSDISQHRRRRRLEPGREYDRARPRVLVHRGGSGRRRIGPTQVSTSRQSSQDLTSHPLRSPSSLQVSTIHLVDVV